jgi:hypothetical protein
MRKIITGGFPGDFNLPEAAREHLTASGAAPKPVADTVTEPVKPIELVEPTTGPAKPEPTPEPVVEPAKPVEAAPVTEPTPAAAIAPVEATKPHD